MTNLCDAFSSQSRSPNSTIPYVRYSYLLCNSNFIFKRRRFTIFDFKKCRDLEIGVRGHSRSLKMAPFERLCMVSYYCSLLILSLKAKMHHFWDIRLQNCRDLENRVRGPSRSLQMSPCDRSHMTSYCCSIVTLAVSCVVSEIFNVEKCRDLEIGVKVTQGHWEWYYSIDCYGFLLVFFSNFVPKIHRFWDIRFLKCHDIENRVWVRQGHWKCHHLIERIRLPIDVL